MLAASGAGAIVRVDRSVETITSPLREIMGDGERQRPCSSCFDPLTIPRSGWDPNGQRPCTPLCFPLIISPTNPAQGNVEPPPQKHYSNPRISFHLPGPSRLRNCVVHFMAHAEQLGAL